MKPLLVIVGETSSGKSALAVELAQTFGGEIICADSATVRRGLDIGTAKPSTAERAQVHHHLLDIVGPDDRFTVADFKRLAEKAIADIYSRGKLPILVGGTGLYVDSILYDYGFGTEGAPDRQHIRANCLILGIRPEREELKRRIEARVDAMLSAGLENEVITLVGQYGWKSLALKNVGYAQWRGYFNGTATMADTRNLIVRATINLAKRQRTWFKRNKSTHWLNTPVNLADVVATVTTFLNT